MIKSFFFTCSSLLSVYSFVCLIRILMSWMPQTEDTPVGRFVAGLCDPYLNWFRRFSFTRVGMVDFSAILALGVLSVASMSLSTIGATGHISVGVILAALVQVLWSFFGFFLTIIILFLAVRLVYDLVVRYGYSPFWTMMDRFLNPPITYVTGLFSHGRALSYRASLILTLIVMLVIRIGLGIGVEYLVAFLKHLPL